MLQLAQTWQFFFLALAVALIAAPLAKRSTWLYWLFVWPGVVVHEGLHFIAGFLSFARPLNFVFWPSKHPDGSVSLGHVDFGNIRWYNAAIAGLAPLGGWPIAVWLSYWATSRPLGAAEAVLLVYVMSAIIRSAIPSPADIKIAIRSWPLLIVAVIFWDRITGWIDSFRVIVGT